MAKVVDYYLSLVSPFTYLGSRELEAIAERRGAEIRVKPMDLVGTVFPETGGVPLGKRPPARLAYRKVEMRRWREARGLPLNEDPAHFPAPEALAACAVVAAGETNGDPLKLAHAILRAVWAEERNIAEHGTVQAIAEETGHHGPTIMARAADPETRAAYEALTREAIDAGVFGSPFYIYEGEPFWGQDRLDFLDRALAAR